MAFTVAAFFAGATFLVDVAADLAGIALAGALFLVTLGTFLVTTGLAADLVGDFGVEAVPVDLVVTARDPTLAVLAALADLDALAELLAGAAFFIAVTSTSSQGVVGPALVGASAQAGLP
ncbi:MAG TPA: hypothetical protein VNV87_13210 [Acidimicrobiales bacterium]|nr:hypothetical protein [Acidimicrobiales bacterium]